MTIQFTSEERPHQMVFTHMYDTNDNLSYIYTINYSDIKPVDGLYTSHIMIDPVAHDPFNAYSNLTFELYNAEGDIYDCRIRKNVETTYLAGNRYTAPIKDLDRTGWPAWVGDGSEETPYEISSATMLCKVSRATSSDTDGDFEEETSHYLSAYYKVTADIELGDESFSSIASNTYFRGSFDGGGHTISGLTTTLFEGLSGATIERVTVKGTGADRAGVAKTALEETTIDDCHNYIPITGSNNYIGGIVYKCQSSTISNCTNHATVNGGSNDKVGGVVGYFTNSTIYNCINYGAVSGSSKVGGVIGESTTDKCYIYNCSNHGAVVGENNYIGGVVGDANNSTITNCYNSAKVASDINNSESKNVGGVVGYIDSSTLLNCYNLAEIEGYNLVGGVAGSLTSSSSLNNCYSSAATITGTQNYGGLVGSANGNITSGYYLDSVTGGNSYGESMTDEKMKSVDFVFTLNNAAAGYNKDNTLATQLCSWVSMSGGYPAFDYNDTPEYVEPDADIIYADGIYKIVNEVGMIAFANLVNGKENTSEAYISGDGVASFSSMDNQAICGELMADITLTEAWTPIGGYDIYSNTRYQGTFNGAGHTISGLSIDSTSDNVGLFGAAKNAVFKNLVVEGSIKGSSYVGGIVGIIVNTSSSGSITNCVSSVQVEATTQYAGGIAGQVGGSDVSIANCYNIGTITAPTAAGGIAGSARKVENCYNNGKINCTNSYGYILGTTISENNTILNCYNNIGKIKRDKSYSEYTWESYYKYVTEFTPGNMQSDSFVTLLNNNASAIDGACGWVKVDDGYPTLDFSATVPAAVDLLTSKGAGTEGDPYIIELSTQLRLLADRVNDGTTYSDTHFEMNQDISLSGIYNGSSSTNYNLFDGIGGYDGSTFYYFCGVFDGGGYTISDLCIISEYGEKGLFGCTKNATLKNITVKGSIRINSANNQSSIGGIAGFMRSSQLNNCHSDVGIVIDATSTYTSSIGGVVGYYTDGTITNCSNRNSLKASSCWDIGGVVGELKGNIEGCYNSGRLQGLYNVGGIVGLLSSDNSTISNCYNSNLVSASINGYDTTSKPTAGGIVGSTNNATNCTIEYCYSRETIASSIADYNGGIMGFSYENNSVINCYYLDDTASGIMSSAYDYDISITSSGSVSADTLKNTDTLDALNAGGTGAWEEDSSALNEGYPVLSWQK